jgi:hypothetical protein
MPRLLIVAAVLVGAIGCAIPEEDFPVIAADAWCDKSRKCDRGDFDNTYPDKAACLEDSREYFDTLSDLADLFGGDYDDAVARECINEVRLESCADFTDGAHENTCDDVWN